MRPRIGITSGLRNSGSAEAPRCELYLAADYADAVLAAGGLPVPLPVPADAPAALVSEIVGGVDGLLFTGGPDLDAQAYGQPRHPATQPMHPRRQRFELALFRAADATAHPILAICLGFQVAHVARGGQLLQHTDDLRADPVVAHHRADGQSAYHPVRIAPESGLARSVGRGGAAANLELEVNSRHHQAVRPEHAGHGLVPVAWSPDGLLEASEDMAGRFLLAVQWHPEKLVERPAHLGLFRALVDAAAERSRS